MKKELYRAAVRGDIAFLKEARAKDVEATVAAYSDDDVVGLTSRGNNIIHIAAEHGHLDFIKVALESFSGLLSWKNKDGDTPLHMAAKQPTSAVAEHLIAVMEAEAEATSLSPPCLWRVQNNCGNTPLHVALINGGKSIQVAAFLIRIGPEVASFPNLRHETPLHLAVLYDNEGGKRSMTNMVNRLKGLSVSLHYMRYHFEEDTLSVITSLLEIDSTVCCLQDENGMTPLLRATRNSYLRAVNAIISYCPESIEICDLQGRTLLHYMKLPSLLEARNFLNIPEISILMDRQDENGNTAAQIAVMNRDYNMVIAMMECNANFVIKNTEGASTTSLIESKLISSHDDNMEEEIRQISMIKGKVMPKELFEAAYNENWQYLLQRLYDSSSDDEQFVCRLPDYSNIVHAAVERCPHDYSAEYIGCLDDDKEYNSKQEEFIVEALKKFPILSCQTDFRGGTPLHIVINRSILNPGGRGFLTLEQHLRRIKDDPSCVMHVLPPWEAKDDRGDTLLHVAIRDRRFKFGRLLIELHPMSVVEINYNKETPLHTLCRCENNWVRNEEENYDMLDLLLEKDVHGTTVYSYDVEGFTPFLRAVKANRLKIATRILQHCPQSIQQFDSQYNRSVFHLMDLNPDEDDTIGREFSKLPHVQNFFSQRDTKGNSPLHLAIEEGRFGTAKILMEHFDDNIAEYKKRNKDGKTALEVLSQVKDIPRWFQDFLSSKALDLPFGIKDTGNSFYGVRFIDVKEYMGPLGVVAGLLATITFTAAFTIPGGYDQNIGTPIMAKKVAFQVFMFTDVVGMCSSMMVLFCLLWFLNSGRVEQEGSDLVDLSIALLQLSFHATLLAFMTGVYVTTFPDVHWLAIFTCVLCTLVLLLMRKRFILDFVVPVFDFLYFYSKRCSTSFAACTRSFTSFKSHKQAD